MPRCLLVYEPPEGGVAEHVLRLAVGLRERGWDVTVCGPLDSIVYPELELAGVPVTRLPFRAGYGSPRADLHAFRGLSALLRHERFDIIHLHSAKAGVLGRLAPRAGGALLYSPHLFRFVTGGRLRRRLALAVERALAGRAEAIVCVAAQERELALRRGVAPPRKLPVVYSGVECPAGLEADERLEALAREGPLAACLTVLRPQKTVHVFLEAAGRVLDQMPWARLAVVGDGPLKGELERRAAELGIADRVSFIPFVPPSARQLRSLDVYVLPSGWEALPIGILEALACGVPQVVTDVGGNSEAVADGETGLLCPPNDPDALARALLRLLGDERLRERMASASLERHARLFRLETMVETMAGLYGQVLGGSSAGPVEATQSGAFAS